MVETPQNQELAPISTDLPLEEQAEALRTKLNAIETVQGKSPVPAKNLDAFLAANPELKEDFIAFDFNVKNPATIGAVGILDDFLDSIAIPVRKPSGGPSPVYMTEAEAVAAGFVVINSEGGKQPAPGFEWADTRKDSTNYAVIVEGGIHEEGSTEPVAVGGKDKVELSDVEKLAIDIEDMGYTDAIWEEFLTSVAKDGLPDRSALEWYDSSTDAMYAKKVFELGKSPNDFAQNVKKSGGLKADEVDWVTMAAPRYMKWYKIQDRMRLYEERKQKYDAEKTHWTDETGRTVSIIEAPKDRSVTVTLQGPPEAVEGAPITQKITATRDRLDELKKQYTSTNPEKLSTLEQTQVELTALAEEYEKAEASGDSGKTAQVEVEIKSIYEAVFTEWEQNYVAPAAAPKARRRPQGAVVMTSGPQHGGDVAEEAAEEPEVKVDYREKAKADPDQYKSEKTGGAGKGSFKFDTHDNLDADLAIRVEDLMGDQHDLVLTSTSPRFKGLEFTYNPEGVDGKGASWYAGNQRLIIRSGDIISYEKPEAAAVATVEASAPVVAPGGAVIPPPAVEVVNAEKIPTAAEVEAGKVLLAAATNARDKVEKLEAIKKGYIETTDRGDLSGAIAAADTALAEAYHNFDGAMTALESGYVGEDYDLVAKTLRLTAGQERAVAFFKANPTKVTGATDDANALAFEDTEEEIDIGGKDPSSAVLATAPAAAPTGVAGAADAGAIPPSDQS